MAEPSSRALVEARKHIQTIEDEPLILLIFGNRFVYRNREDLQVAFDSFIILLAQFADEFSAESILLHWNQVHDIKGTA